MVWLYIRRSTDESTWYGYTFDVQLMSRDAPTKKMVKMVPHEAFACRYAEGDVVLRQSYKPESYGKLYYACPKSKPPKHFGCEFFLWKETRLRELMSSPGAPSTPSYSTGHSTPPSYSSGPPTPPSYSSGSLRNEECSNCKHLRGKITVQQGKQWTFIKASGTTHS
ncbi:hypothetical protein Tco_1187677 [Tanacetum coccineum]